jgi:two-component system, sensor histidine kinase
MKPTFTDIADQHPLAAPGVAARELTIRRREAIRPLPRRATALLPRLLADCVLPCALAALTMAGMLVLRELHGIDADEAADAQAWVWLCGVLGASGVVLLILFATRALRYRVLWPLRQLQAGLDRLLAGDEAVLEQAPTPAGEFHQEFAAAQSSIHALARLLAAHRRDWAAIQRDSASDALDRLRQSQAAIRGKSQFMAAVGHHFRQPLQALQLLAATLHPGIDTEQQALLAQMRDSIGTMTRLLDALLEISRLDAGVVTVTSGPFRVAELFLRERAWLDDEARQHDVELSWRGEKHRLEGDVELVAALLRQLAGNAIAFAPPGGRVLIAARRHGANVRIEVRDNGPGIAAIHQQRIFEEFVQLHDEGERREGYGLGLAIAARLARLLGTRVELRSEPGRGSVFWFDLPREVNAAIPGAGGGFGKFKAGILDQG